MSSKMRRAGYDHRKLAIRLKELLAEHNASPRMASLGAGLDHGAVLRFLKGEFRPARDACIELAVYFDVNPNELLQLAGYEPMPIFDLSLIDPDEFPVEVKRVAKTLSAIADVSVRRQMCKAILLLLEGRMDLVRTPPVGTRHVRT